LSVRVVVWNIANINLAFDALARLNPDVALLNEASPPPTLNGIWVIQPRGETASGGRGRPLC
jgi:hypothetical protein